MPDRSAYTNLDYAASTPLRAAAQAAMAAYDDSTYAGANPNALHSLGRAAARSLETARRDIARSLGARVRPHEVIFTSGGTESNHLALLGIAEAVRAASIKRDRVIISAIEHDSILDNARLLEARGFTVECVAPTSTGTIEPSALEALIDERCALVSVMFANNETGIVQPVSELAAIAHAHGAFFHSDAIQGYLHIPFDVRALGVDAISIAAHKVGGPVGVGALWVASRVPLSPQVLGGGQESGRRAGTQDVRGASAFAAVARELSPRVAEDAARVRAVADRTYRMLLEHPRIQATMGDPFSTERLPGIISIAVAGADSEDMILKLDERGFGVSAGSACSAGSASVSHVLTAMGLPERLAAGSLRISFDDRTDPAALDSFCHALLAIAG